MLSSIAENVKNSLVNSISVAADVIEAVRDNTKKHVVVTVNGVGDAASLSLYTVSDVTSGAVSAQDESAH